MRWHIHKWSEWELITVRVLLAEQGSGVGRHWTTDRQERRCKRCGKYERAHVGTGL